MLDQAMALTFKVFVCLLYTVFPTVYFWSLNVCNLHVNEQIAGTNICQASSALGKKPFSVSSLTSGWHLWILFSVDKLVKQIVIFSEWLFFPQMALYADAAWPRVLVRGILTGFLHLLNKRVVDTVRGFSKNANTATLKLSWGIPLLCWMHRRWALLFQGGWAIWCFAAQ